MRWGGWREEGRGDIRREIRGEKGVEVSGTTHSKSHPPFPPPREDKKGKGLDHLNKETSCGNSNGVREI